ncbi:MAG: hypothetical protein AB1816_10600 [Bacillota bacterium]
MKIWLALGLLVAAVWCQLAILGLATAGLVRARRGREEPRGWIRAEFLLWAGTVVLTCAGICLGGLP